MAEHIASHLQSLMLVTIRLLKIEDAEGEDIDPMKDVSDFTAETGRSSSLERRHLDEFPVRINAPVPRDGDMGVESIVEPLRQPTLNTPNDAVGLDKVVDLQSWLSHSADKQRAQTSDHSAETRDRVVKEASLGSPKNLISRFIPRNDLLRLVNPRVVSNMLRFADSSMNQAAVARTVVRVCPDEERCGCGRRSCTGARVLFATLAMMASEDRITPLFGSAQPGWLCDNNPGLGSAEISSPDLGLDLILADWPSRERELFQQLQWEVRSPYFSGLLCDPPKLNERITLPWIELDNPKLENPGQFSVVWRVWRVKIHPHHHNMVR
jgi:hypothetical protein